MAEKFIYSGWNIAGIALLVTGLNSCVNNISDMISDNSSLTDNFTIQASNRAHLISRGITIAHCLPEDVSLHVLENSETNFYMITTINPSRTGLQGGVLNQDGTVSAGLVDCDNDGLGNNGIPRELAPARPT